MSGLTKALASECERECAHFQRAVGEWADATFPRADWYSILDHMEEEVRELRQAIGESPRSEGVSAEAQEEAADVLLLLLHLAHKEGFSLLDAAIAKDAANRLRTWETDDNGRGYWKHLSHD